MTNHQYLLGQCRNKDKESSKRSKDANQPKFSVGYVSRNWIKSRSYADLSNTSFPPFIWEVGKEIRVLDAQPGFNICLLETGSCLQTFIGEGILYLSHTGWFWWGHGKRYWQMCLTAGNRKYMMVCRLIFIYSAHPTPRASPRKVPGQRETTRERDQMRGNWVLIVDADGLRK